MSLVLCSSLSCGQLRLFLVGLEVLPKESPLTNPTSSATGYDLSTHDW